MRTRYGRLKVIEKTNKRKRNRKTFLWKFECECGAIVYAELAQVINGKTRSCGCLQRDNRIKEQQRMKRQALVQHHRRFQELTAPYIPPDEDTLSWEEELPDVI